MKNKTNIWKRWYMIVLYCFVGLVLIGFIVTPDNPTIYETEYTKQSNIEAEAKPVTKISEPDLEIIDLSCEYGEYGWIYVKGRVKNNGNTNIDYVEVSIDLFNNGDWVESSFTYIRNTHLPAGRTDSFKKTFTEDNLRFTNCEVFLS